MTNRYYRPSVPRYTSQFIEEPYPAELIMQSGAMKNQQLQEIRKGLGEFESIIDEYTQPGYRTVELAPEVRDEWHNKLQSTISQYATDYDSAQAIQAFSKLRSQWVRDPNINLIKMDREVGNPQWDNILKSSSYDIDIKPDLNPATGTLWQFDRDSQFQQYKGSFKFGDMSKYADDAYGNIPTEKKFMYNEGPYIDALGRTAIGTVQGDFEYRDPDRIRTETKKLMEDIKYGRTQEGLYTKERLKYGLGREPSDEEIYSELYPAEQKAMLKKESLRRSKEVPDMDKLTGKDDITTPVKIPWGSAEQTFTNMSRKGAGRINRILSRNPDAKLEDYEELSQLRAHNEWMNGVDYSNMTQAEKKKADKQFISQKQNEPYRLTFDDFGSDNKFKKQLTEVLTSDTYANGAINIPKGATLAGSALEGIRIWEYDTMKEIGVDKGSAKDKSNLLAPDSQFYITGKVSTTDARGNDITSKQVAPGLFGVEAKGKRYLMQIPSLISDEERITWNINGDSRDYISSTGDTWGVYYGRASKDNVLDRGIDITDINDTQNKEETEVRGQLSKGDSGTLFYKTVFDYNKGNKVIKVYSKNPQQDSGEQNKGILNNKNKYFVREYDMSEYGYDVGSIFNQLLEDSGENLIKAKEINDRSK